MHCKEQISRNLKWLDQLLPVEHKNMRITKCDLLFFMAI